MTADMTHQTENTHTAISYSNEYTNDSWHFSLIQCDPL